MGGGGAGSTFYSTPEYEEIQEKEKLLVPITQTWYIILSTNMTSI